MARRNRRRTSKLPTSKGTIAVIVIGILVIGLLTSAIILGMRGLDMGARIFASLGTISIFLSAGCFIYSIRLLTAHEYALVGRLLALVLSLGGMVLWIGVYLAGLIASYS